MQKEMIVKCPYCGTIVKPRLSVQFDFDEKYRFKTGICPSCQKVLSSKEIDDNCI